MIPFDLIDTSPLNELNQGPQASDLARLDRIQHLVRQLTNARTEFSVLDNAAINELIEREKHRYRYLYDCNGCELDLAHAANAELVMVGWVQKVSNLILNMNIVIRDAATGQDIAGASVDMRGNTDESWSRAAHRLIEDDLLRSYRRTAHKQQ
ncbi:DUF3280 domain-containing protein [Modicisalibacter luteus]|uniref:DUF3280 domain-containing protein n=1 Tax=Modicisalibacter luteus TaxID=453962 RepID=A0ABV7LZD7_9GAMM|nr:DUF3280 domain-containing protein [Halomonas lutea]GHB01546.1 hypothetical protein GCM10007159_24240 [Halomonas lutea]